MGFPADAFYIKLKFSAGIEPTIQFSPAAKIKKGDPLTITLTFPENIRLEKGAATNLVLQVGAATNNLGYVVPQDLDADNFNQLVFTYEIKDGDQGQVRIPASGLAAVKVFAGGRELPWQLPGKSGPLIDNQPPWITEAAFNPASGLVERDKPIKLTVTFFNPPDTEPVVLKGASAGASPSVAFRIGGQERTALYSRLVDDDRALEFSYVIKSGDNGAVSVAAGTGIHLPLGVGIEDQAGNQANTALPAVATGPTVDTVHPKKPEGLAIRVTSDNNTIVSEDLTYGSSEQLVINAVNGPVTDAKDGVTVTVTLAEPGGWLEYSTDSSSDWDRVDVDPGNFTTFTLPEGRYSPVSGNNTRIRVRQRDAAGNAGSELVNVRLVIVDISPPTVTDVVFDSGSSGRTVNDEIKLTLSFSEPVEVIGSPNVPLTIGGDDGRSDFATFQIPGGVVPEDLVTDLVFVYTVKAEDNGWVAAGAPIVLPSATTTSIRDAAGNDAYLTLPSEVTGPRITTKPTIAAVTLTPLPSVDPLPEGAKVILTVTFTLKVTVRGEPTVKLDIGTGTGTAKYGRGSGGEAIEFEYTVAKGDIGEIKVLAGTEISLEPADRIRDSYGKSAYLILDQEVTGPTVDAKAPTVKTVSLSGADSGGSPKPTLKAGDVAKLIVTFDEAVKVTTGIGTPSVALSGLGADRNFVYDQALTSALNQVDKVVFSYTVAAGDNGVISVAATDKKVLNGNSITDEAATAAGPFQRLNPAAKGGLGPAGPRRPFAGRGSVRGRRAGRRCRATAGSRTAETVSATALGRQTAAAQLAVGSEAGPDLPAKLRLRWCWRWAAAGCGDGLGGDSELGDGAGQNLGSHRGQSLRPRTVWETLPRSPWAPLAAAAVLAPLAARSAQLFGASSGRAVAAQVTWAAAAEKVDCWFPVGTSAVATAAAAFGSSPGPETWPHVWPDGC
ncbi:hypothetical protein ACF0H5_024586 [Mactra antiquata]